MDSYTIGLSHDKYKILVHGGAWDIPDHLKDAHREGVETAWHFASESLESGMDPLTAVSLVLKMLEDDPTFDAGLGSFLNEVGDVEMDASLMRGSDLAAGCIGGIRNFANPSQIALKLLQDGTAVFLTGEGAEIFALDHGFKKSSPSSLVLPREMLAHQKWIEAGRPDPKLYFSKRDPDLGSTPDRRGTVGCVIGVPNSSGHYSLYAGTSTGGVPGKKRGRLGDVPVIGAGIIADDEGVAVSATGWGEGLLRISAAMIVNERVKSGIPLPDAVAEALHQLKHRLGGHGGLIAIDHLGHQAAAFTTPDMAFAGKDVTRL
ncbi:MAG: isoaspartyl peptidase/L-asparaginase [Pseudomonadota bacterium]